MKNQFLTHDEKSDNIKKWVSFFRKNPHRCAEMYLGIKLHPYQIYDFYAMGKYSKYGGVKSRATAKSWTAGTYACVHAILYPHSEIVIVAETKGQAGQIINKKIRPLYESSSNLHAEIKNIVTNQNEYVVEFYNGSNIFVVPLKDTARGYRSTIIIYEEFRQLDTQKLNEIISPFKSTRGAPFFLKEEYYGYIEEAKEIYITSSGYEYENWWKTIKRLIYTCADGGDAMVLFADYEFAVRYRIKTKKQIIEERKELGEVTFAIEYENRLMRENRDAFFESQAFENVRNVKVAYYPQIESRYNEKNNPLCPKLSEGEFLILVIDFATAVGKDNDNTILEIFKCTPTKEGYYPSLRYMESYNGENSVNQVLRIKQLWYDFSCSYLVLDINGQGAVVYDYLTAETFDESRGITYPALSVMNHDSIGRYEDYKQRVKSLNSLPIIYTMYATEDINSEAAYCVRDMMKNNQLSLMCSPLDGEEFLLEKAKYFNPKQDMGLKKFFMMPYYQTSELQNEMRALKPLYKGQKVKLVEGGGRKDRYSCLSYGCWFVYKVLNPRIVKEKEDFSLIDMYAVSGNSNNRNGKGKLFSNGNGAVVNRPLFGGARK